MLFDNQYEVAMTHLKEASYQYDYYSFTDYGNEKDYYGMVEKILSQYWECQCFSGNRKRII